jgi:hypothetical protein
LKENGGEEAIYSNAEAEEWNRESSTTEIQPIHAAPSLMSLRSCIQPSFSAKKGSDPLYQNQQIILSHVLHAHSQPQLSHSCSQPFLASQLSLNPGGYSVKMKRSPIHGKIISSSVDKLTTIPHSHTLLSNEGVNALRAFHEQVKTRSALIVGKGESSPAASSQTINHPDQDITVLPRLHQSGGLNDATRFSQVSFGSIITNLIDFRLN